jgi:rubrerythrin
MALLTGDEVVEIAIRLEESGEAFYTAAAEKANDLDVKALFQQLALQEMYHRRAFQQMDRGTVQAVLTADQWEEFQAYTGALLQQSFFDRPEDALNVAARAEDERTALQAALNFEKETLLFFYELKDVVRNPGQQVVERIIQQEKRHIRRLSEMLGAG